MLEALVVKQIVYESRHFALCIRISYEIDHLYWSPVDSIRAA